MRPKLQLAQMLALAVVASALGVAGALAIDWFPTRASTEAKQVDDLWDILLIASVPIFVLVQGIVLFCVWKFRARPGEEDKDGPPIHGHTGLEVIWTVIPALLMFGLSAYSYIVLVDIERPPAREPMIVNVTAQQFTWTFEYPGTKVGGKPLRSERLYLQSGRPAEFHVRSKDVIHDFWVPEFRLKIDAVPGITTEYRVQPTRAGTYTVVCAELCGLGHATMRQSATVLTPAGFRTWTARQRASAAGGAQADTTDPS